MLLGAGGMVAIDQFVASPRRERLIVLAGPAESGKSTILATIYDAFQESPFAGYYFAGSRTLLPFEERCHESRLESGLDFPDTPRTSRAQVGELLHLRLATAPSTQVGLMLHDISGEYFERLIARPAQAATMKAISHAQRVAVTVDGGRLSGVGERDETFYQAETLLRAIVDHGGLRPDARLDIVLTKLDVVSSDGDVDDFTKRGLDRLEKVVPAPWRGRTILTASRSQNAAVSARTGLPELLETWVGGSSSPLTFQQVAVQPGDEQ